jgi:hypothetical protein
LKCSCKIIAALAPGKIGVKGGVTILKEGHVVRLTRLRRDFGAASTAATATGVIRKTMIASDLRARSN